MNRVLCIGDSHTAGFPNHDPMFGGEVQSTYQFWLSEKLNQLYPKATFSFINRGVCGDTSGGIISRLFKFLDNGPVDMVIFQGGTNDLGMCSPQKVFDNLKSGYQACGKKGVPVVAVTVPPLNFNECVTAVLSINTAVRAYASKNANVFVADWFKCLATDKNLLKPECDAGDGVHLSVDGYRQAGYTVVEPLLKALK